MAELHHITDRITADAQVDIPAYRLVKWANTNGKLGVALCGIADTPCGINGNIARKAGETGTFYNILAPGEFKMAFSTDAALMAPVYTAANGTVSKTAGTGATELGLSKAAIPAPTGTDYNYGFLVQDAGRLTKAS